MKDLEKAIGHLNKQIKTERRSSKRNSGLMHSHNESCVNFNTADDGTISGQFPIHQNKSFYDEYFSAAIQSKKRDGRNTDLKEYTDSEYKRNSTEAGDAYPSEPQIVS